MGNGHLIMNLFHYHVTAIYLRIMSGLMMCLFKSAIIILTCLEISFETYLHWHASFRVKKSLSLSAFFVMLISPGEVIIVIGS